MGESFEVKEKVSRGEVVRDYGTRMLISNNYKCQTIKSEALTESTDSHVILFIAFSSFMKKHYYISNVGLKALGFFSLFQSPLKRAFLPV